MDNTIEAKVKEVLERDIRPALQADGGNIEFVSIEADGTVKVRLQGACSCCPGAKHTLAMGVERLLREKVPSVKKVVSV